MALCLCATISPTFAQETPPQTRAERTGYKETSSHADVMEFLRALQKPGAPIRVEIIGKSAQGKDIPLAIVAKPMVKNAAEARKQGKAVIYIQANIHGGEVEGKEAILHILRTLVSDTTPPDRERIQRDLGSPSELLKNLVLLVTPIYNIDGNDKLGPNLRNRSSQDGPEQVGERPNGQGLDLNRDCMKVASNEMRAALSHIYNAWEPDAVLDLHTTDGTRHGFEMTYAPPMNPNTDPGILDLSRVKLLEAIRQDMGKMRYFDYGNVEGRGEQRAWRTFGEEGRYVTNYGGLRGSVSILTEAASFLPFERRVRVTKEFVGQILQRLSQSKKEFLSTVREARLALTNPKHKDHPKELGVRFEMARGADETFQLEKPNSGVARNKAPIDFDTVKLPVYDRFKTVKTAAFPAAYLIPADQPKVIEILQRHGVLIERLKSDWRGQAQAFTISEIARGGSNFSGQTPRLEGKFESVAAEGKTGDFLVRASQPLGRLLFMLLEPESLDGVSAWGFLAAEPKVGDRFPILKLLEVPKVSTEKVKP
jgi:hypothetical protein